MRCASRRTVELPRWQHVCKAEQTIEVEGEVAEVLAPTRCPLVVFRAGDVVRPCAEVDEDCAHTHDGRGESAVDVSGGSVAGWRRIICAALTIKHALSVGYPGPPWHDGVLGLLDPSSHRLVVDEHLLAESTQRRAEGADEANQL